MYGAWSSGQRSCLWIARPGFESGPGGGPPHSSDYRPHSTNILIKLRPRWAVKNYKKNNENLSFFCLSLFCFCFISKVRTNLIREIVRFFVSDHFPKFVLLLNYSLPNFSQHFLFGTFCFNIFSLHREAGQDGACTRGRQNRRQTGQ